MADGIVDRCLHDLTTRFCPVCKGNVTAARNAVSWEGAASAARSSSSSSPWSALLSPYTDAKFIGECPDCGEPIQLNELIGLRDGEWCCNQCSSEYDIEATAMTQHPSGKEQPAL